MSEMVERIASAIRRVNEETIGLRYTALTEAMARAAIEAMRKPTDAMVEHMQADSHGRSRDEIIDIWERGLLEALR